MSYYRGDYYAGGIGSFFGNLAKNLVGGIPVIGGALKGVLGAIPTGAAKSGAIASAAGAGMAIVKSGAGAIRSGIVKHPVLSAAGAAGAALAAGAVGSRMMHPAAAAVAAGMCTKGFHIIKHGPNAGACTRNRRMNPCNGRALSRATRRLHAFAKRYRKVVGFVAPHKPKGRMYFKIRKHK